MFARRALSVALSCHDDTADARSLQRQAALGKCGFALLAEAVEHHLGIFRHIGTQLQEGPGRHDVVRGNLVAALEDHLAGQGL